VLQPRCSHICWCIARITVLLMRLTCPQWRNIHDGSRKMLQLAHRATDDMVGALCVRMPALTELGLQASKGLTDEGLGRWRG
jgi:hypothetical protein